MNSYNKIANNKLIGFDKVIAQCEENILFYSKHLETLRGNIGLLDEATSLIKEINQNASLKDFEEMRHFSNYNGYVTIANLDISVNLKHLIEAKTDWERIFFIKNSFLIIHETINKLNPSNGKSIIELTIQKKYPTLSTTLKQLFDAIDHFKLTVDYSKIENNRHYTAGHIEKSFKKYYDTVSLLDGEEAAKFISIFIPIINMATDLTSKLVKLAYVKQSEKSEPIYAELSKLKNVFEALKCS